MLAICPIILATVVVLFTPVGSAFRIANLDRQDPPSGKVTPTSLLNDNNFTGVARAWGGFEKESWSSVMGYADLQSQRPLHLDSKFPIASNTKLIVAIAMYQLQERGLVNLSDSIANHLGPADFAAFGYPSMTSYCPKVKGSSPSSGCAVVTFQQLMAMTAGIPVDPIEEFLEFPGNLALTVGASILSELLFTPGTAYFYSNPSFNLCAYFIEKFSGIKYGAYLKQFIFNPAGMTSSYWDPFNGKFGYDADRVSEFYQFIDPTTKLSSGVGKCTSELDLGSIAGAGGVVSTTRDEMRLYFQLFNFTAINNAADFTSPFFKSIHPIMEIIKPRIAIPNGAGFYFGQGITAYQPDITAPLPVLLQYEGGLMCTTTGNVFDVKKRVMTQVYSSVPVYYATEADLQSLRDGEVGAPLAILNLIPTSPSVAALAENISAMLFGPF